MSVLPCPPAQTVPQVLICQEELHQAKHALKRAMLAQSNLMFLQKSSYRKMFTISEDANFHKGRNEGGGGGR